MIRMRGPTYRGLQQLGGAAEILPLVSRPEQRAYRGDRTAGPMLAESRRIWNLFRAQQDELNRRSAGRSLVGASGVSGGASVRHGGPSSRTLDVFDSPSARSPSSDGASMTAKGEGRSGIQSQSSSAAVTAAAAAALYGTSAAAISEARVGLIDASQLPSEAKRAFMSRLMSATLIELTAKIR